MLFDPRYYYSLVMTWILTDCPQLGYDLDLGTHTSASMIHDGRWTLDL